MTTLTTTIRNADTEALLDTTAMSLLFGVTTENITALPSVEGSIRIPAEWIKRGRRRTREAEAATGSDFILDVLQYWAQRDHAADLEVVYE